MGASIAFHAARSGASVAIVDAGIPGRATTAGAGIISDYGLDDDDAAPAWMSLVTRSTREYRTLFAELGADAARESEFAEVGEVVVAGDDEERAALDRFEARLLGAALPPRTERLTAADLREMWPYCTGDVVGTFVAGTARVDGDRLAAVLLARAVEAGARSIEGLATPLPDRPTSVDVGGELVRGGRLVVAAGIHAPAFAARLGLSAGVAVEPDRGQIVHIAGDHPVETAPVLKTFDGPYILGFGGGRVVAGATHGDARDLETEPRAGDQSEILANAFRVAPGLRGARIRETRVGFRPRSADGFPIVGELGDDVWIAGGLGSWGLTMAPLLGRLLAAQLGGGEPDLDLAGLGPRRFAA